MKIASEGGIGVILNAMSAHSSHAGVQEQGCGALCNLAANAGERDIVLVDVFPLTRRPVTGLKPRLVSEGAAGAIRRAMSTFSSNTNIQSNGKSVLNNLGPS